MSGMYDYLGLLLDTAVTVYLVRLHRSDCKTINNIKNAPCVDIGPDLTNLFDSDSESSSQEGDTIPYAIIRGHVSPINDKGTLESCTGEKGVIKITTLHDITSRSFGELWDSEKIPPTNETRDSVPWALMSLDSDSPKIKVEVENPFESIWESLLFPTTSSFTPKNTLPMSLMGGIGSAKILGVRKTEKFLRVGTVVTGIGEVVKKNGTLHLREPSSPDSFHPYVLTTLSKDELLCKLEFRKQLQRVIIGMSALVGLVLLGRRMYGWWRSYNMKRVRENIIRERAAINLSDLCRCQTCIACLTNPREVILLDCGHVCLCADCLIKVNGACPVCRETIRSTRKAYIA